MTDKLDLVISNAEEVVTTEEIRTVLTEKPSFNFYYGTAPTGPFHFAYMIPLNKLVQLTSAGGKGTILIADYHAHLDDRKTSFELMDLRSTYYTECIRGVLGPAARKIKFVRGSSYQHKRDYVEDLYKIAARVTTTRATRAASEVVRMKGEPKVSELLYPLLQILDVKYLDADIAVGGIDQRNIYMLGREVLPEIGHSKGCYIFMPLLPSLKGGGAKMSASDPLSHIRVTDSPEKIRDTIMKAYCPPADLSQNAVTSTVSLILFPRYGRVTIPRKEKFGGDIEFTSVKDFQDAYKAGQLHPLDVKQAVADRLIEVLAPAREYFAAHADILEEIERTQESR
ncbi:MAG: tyrosine--tRNA ligase [Candidatus Thorarchaeota archaeon]|nr:tyrosine--tRNA ligase [Candidatus Thorarchaeota archaeon]